MKGLFITGTDTDCGKTRVAVAVIHALREKGLRVAPFKPVAAGATDTAGGLRNPDALQLIEASGREWPYELVNPYCLATPMSPHLAAAAEGVVIEPQIIADAFGRLGAKADLVVVEGAGGWMAPLGETWDIEGLAQMLGLPVILVVGLKLGCLNHARLSVARMTAAGVSLSGWVGSVLDPEMAGLEQNIQTLGNTLGIRCHGVLPSLGDAETGAGSIELSL